MKVILTILPEQVSIQWEKKTDADTNCTPSIHPTFLGERFVFVIYKSPQTGEWTEYYGISVAGPYWLFHVTHCSACHTKLRRIFARNADCHARRLSFSRITSPQSTPLNRQAFSYCAFTTCIIPLDISLTIRRKNGLFFIQDPSLRAPVQVRFDRLNINITKSGTDGGTFVIGASRTFWSSLPSSRLSLPL